MKKYFIAILISNFFLLSAYSLPSSRIVSLSPALTEAIFLLGQGDKLVARSSACNIPAEAASLPVAGKFGEIAVERIMSLQADCVVADTLIDASLIRPLADAGINVHILPCSSVAEYLAAVTELGNLTGAAEEAKKITEETGQTLALFHPLPRPVRTLWVVWTDPLIVAGTNTLPAEAMQIAGLVNAATEKGYFKPSAEWLVQSRAQLVIINRKAGNISDSPLFRDLPAVRRDRVIFLPETNDLERPGAGFLPAVKKLQNEILEMLQ